MKSGIIPEKPGQQDCEPACTLNFKIMSVNNIITGFLIAASLTGSRILFSAPVSELAQTNASSALFEDDFLFDTCSNSFIYETWNNLDFAFSGVSLPVDAIEYHWDFGDGTVGWGQSATHTYDTGQGQAVFTVTLATIVVDSLTGDTCSAISSQEILAGNPSGDCINWFTYFTEDEWTFTFTGNVMPQLPTIFQWDFGDGYTATGEQVVHIFEPAGISFYSVCLTTYTPENSFDTCIAFSCQDVYVGGSGNDCENWFTWEVQGDSTVMFYGESLPPAMYYSWDFGDGQTAVGQDVNHNYDPFAGDLFLVTLTTLASNPVSGDSCVAVSQQLIQVGSGLECNADFTYQEDTATEFTFYFYDNSGPDISGYFWDFNDGSFSSESNPVHVFPGPGSYNVCLTITRDSLGMFCTDMYCTNLLIDFSLVSDFTSVLDTLSDLTRNYTFVDNSTGEPAFWFWDFGDGSFSTDQNPVHQYENSGEYEVCLEVARSFPNGGLYSDSHCKQLAIPYYYDLGGLAFIGNIPINNPASTGDTGIAYLYRRYENAIIPSDTNIFYEFGYFWFPEVREGNFLIKAELTAGSDSYENFAPAYFSNKMKWEDADIIHLADSNYYFADVHLTGITGLQQGTGSVNGVVVAYPDSSGGVPVSLPVPVFLLDETGEPLAYSMTTIDGTFSFGNIALGTYSLYAEATGYYTVATAVVLDAENPIADEIELVIYTDDISGVGEQQSFNLSISNIYPNPASDVITLTIESWNSSAAQIVLFGYSGVKVAEYYMDLNQGKNEFTILLSGFPDGFYLLACKTAGNLLISTAKFIKQ
jgi:PKD repeat protein